MSRSPPKLGRRCLGNATAHEQYTVPAIHKRPCTQTTQLTKRFGTVYIHHVHIELLQCLIPSMATQFSIFLKNRLNLSYAHILNKEMQKKTDCPKNAQNEFSHPMATDPLNLQCLIPSMATQFYFCFLEIRVKSPHAPILDKEMQKTKWLPQTRKKIILTPGH